MVALHEQRPQALNKLQVAILSGYSVKSSSLANALGALRRLGLLQGTAHAFTLTQAGTDRLVALLTVEGRKVPRRPRGSELLEYWSAKLGRCERVMLRAHVMAYPKGLTKQQACAESGYSATSSSVANALGRLRTLGLIEGRPRATANKELIDG